MFSSQSKPCLVCGAPVEPAAAEAHTCDPEQRANHVMSVLREDIAAFETRFRDYLAGSHGRFEAWLAARHIRRSAP